jgi:carbonic anhydrase
MKEDTIMIKLSSKLALALTVCVLAFPVSSNAAEKGKTFADFPLCQEGKAQSPVNMAEYKRGDLEALSMNYAPSRLRVVNNGHTIQANFDAGSSMSIKGKTYNLLQLHFHTPSEHYVDGAPYPMEGHFVHKAEDGTLAVIGVMMKVGQANPIVQGMWDNITMSHDENVVESVTWSAPDFMPESKAYYHYQGSLTTPPCSEGVQWYVLQDPVEISQDQLKAFQKLYAMNARPIQDMHGRVILGNQ